MPFFPYLNRRCSTQQSPGSQLTLPKPGLAWRRFSLQRFAFKVLAFKVALAFCLAAQGSLGLLPGLETGLGLRPNSLAWATDAPGPVIASEPAAVYQVIPVNAQTQVHWLEVKQPKAFRLDVGVAIPEPRALWQQNSADWEPTLLRKLEHGPEAFTWRSVEVAPLALVNGGYFDPKSGQTVSVVERYFPTDRSVSLLPEDNPYLVQNAGLAPYLPAILNRSELRIWACLDGQTRYSIQHRNEPTTPPATFPPECQEACRLQSRLGAGPQLLPHLTAEAGAFYQEDETGKVVRDSIGLTKRNARSAVGLLADGRPVLVVVEQLDVKGGGLSLPELAAWLKQRGVVSALNLDGGSSSSLWLDLAGSSSPTTVWGRRNAKNQPVKRRVLSVLGLIPVQYVAVP